MTAEFRHRHLLGIEPTPWEWIRFSSRWACFARLRTAPVASGAVWVLESFNGDAHLADPPAP